MMKSCKTYVFASVSAWHSMYLVVVLHVCVYARSTSSRVFVPPALARKGLVVGCTPSYGGGAAIRSEAVEEAS